MFIYMIGAELVEIFPFYKRWKCYINHYVPHCDILGHCIAQVQKCVALSYVDTQYGFLNFFFN